MRYDGIIFDLDGTLGNTLPLCIAAFREAIEPLAGRGLSDADIIATFGPSEEGTVMALAPERYDEGVAAYLSRYEALHDMCPAPFDGVRDLLQELAERGVRVGLVTGKGLGSAVITLNRFGLDFADIEAGSPSGPRKADGLRAMAQKWAIKPERALYVGDAVSDVEAAHAAGVQIAGAAWAGTTDAAALAQAEPDELFTTFAAFSSWLLTQEE